MEKFFSRIIGKNKLLSLIEVSRPWNGLACSLTALIGFFLLIPHFSFFDIILIFISTICIFTAGTAVNDLFGLEIDRLNMPFRPLQQKKVTVKEVLLFAIITYLIGLTAAFLMGLGFLICMMLFLVITLVYSVPPITLEKRGFFAQIGLAIATVLIPGYGGAVYAFGSFLIPINIILSLITFTSLFSFVLIIKDFKDVEGDKKYNKKTFVLRIGFEKAKKVCIIGTILFFPLTVYLFNILFQSAIYVGISILLFFTLLLVEKETKLKEEKSYGKVRIIMLLNIVLILVFSIFYSISLSSV